MVMMTTQEACKGESTWARLWAIGGGGGGAEGGGGGGGGEGRGGGGGGGRGAGGPGGEGREREILEEEMAINYCQSRETN